MKHAIEAIEALYQRALPKIKAEVSSSGKISGERLNQWQLGAHALAYIATELNACNQLATWSKHVGDEWSHDVAAAYVGEVARSLRAGVELTSSEFIALEELGLSAKDVAQTVGQ